MRIRVPAMINSCLSWMSHERNGEVSLQVEYPDYYSGVKIWQKRAGCPSQVGDARLILKTILV